MFFSFHFLFTFFRHFYIFKLIFTLLAAVHTSSLYVLFGTPFFFAWLLVFGFGFNCQSNSIAVDLRSDLLYVVINLPFFIHKVSVISLRISCFKQIYLGQKVNTRVLKHRFWFRYFLITLTPLQNLNLTWYFELCQAKEFEFFGRLF